MRTSKFTAFFGEYVLILKILCVGLSGIQAQPIPDVLKQCGRPHFLEPDHRGNTTAVTSCCTVSRFDGPLGPTVLPRVSAALTAAQLADMGAWFDAGAAVLQAATDRFWGEYAIGARCLVTALRLAPPRRRAAAGEAAQLEAAAHSNLGFAFQRLREHAGGAWRWKVAQSRYRPKNRLHPPSLPLSPLPPRPRRPAARSCPS